MAEQKNINLMPEDLRSKEDQILSKKKQNFEPDFVIPGKGDKPKWTAPKESGPTFWSRLANIFKSKPASPKVSQDNKDAIKHIPVPEEKPTEKKEMPDLLNVDSGQVDAGQMEEKRDFNIPELKPIKLAHQEEKKFKEIKKEKEHKEKAPKAPKIKKSGPSFWSRFARLFKSRPTAPKAPKVKKEKEHKEKAPEPPKIVEAPIKKEEHKEKAPESPKIVEAKLEKPLDLPDKFISLHKPEEKSVPPAPAPTPEPVATPDPILEPTPEAPKVVSDFSIPQEKSVPPTPAPTPEPVATPDPILEEPKEKMGGFHTPSPRIRARFLDDDSGVDLIPTAAKTRSWKQIINLLVMSIIGSLLVLGLFYGALVWQDMDAKNKKQLKSQQISDIEEQILGLKSMNDEIKSLGDEIKLVHGLLNQHIYWTRFFELLEKYTIDGVYYSGFSAGTGGGLTLNATGPDYYSVGKQLKVLQSEEASEFVESVSITAASGSEAGVSFSIVLVLNQDLFYYQDPTSQNGDEAENNQ